MIHNFTLLCFGLNCCLVISPFSVPKYFGSFPIRLIHIPLVWFCLPFIIRKKKYKYILDVVASVSVWNILMVYVQWLRPSMKILHQVKVLALKYALKFISFNLNSVGQIFKFFLNFLKLVALAVCIFLHVFFFKWRIWHIRI